jgi:hypothetical protein
MSKSRITKVEYVQYQNVLRFRITENSSEFAVSANNLDFVEILKPSQFLVNGVLAGFREVGSPYVIAETEDNEFALCKDANSDAPQNCIVLTSISTKDPLKLEITKHICRKLSYPTRFRTSDRKIRQIYLSEAEAIKLLDACKD